MASGWVKSLQSKSRASDDVFNPDSKHLLPSSSCTKTSSEIIKDVIIETKTAKHHPINQNQQKLKPQHVSTTPSLSRSTRNSDLVFPALAELPEGHPSRDYPSHELEQQIISGSDRDAFQSENGSRTVTRFEEYRENVKIQPGLPGVTTWECLSGRSGLVYKAIGFDSLTVGSCLTR